MVQYVQQSGAFGPAVMFIMFVLQAVVPVIPYGILAVTAGAIFGNTGGFLLAWTGAVLGTSSVYFFSRYRGRDFFRHWIEKYYTVSFESMNGLTVFALLLLFRILPIIPLPVVNICSGLSGVPWRMFVSAAALGTMPWAAAFTFLGNYASISNDITTPLKYAVFIMVIICIGAYVMRRRVPLGKKKYR